MSTPNPQTENPEVPLHVCKNCENTFTGIVCNQCGQKPHADQITLKGLVLEFIKERRHDAEEFIFTTKELMLRPGKVVEEYLSGKHKKYYNAINYFFLISAVSAFLTFQFSDFEAEKSVAEIEKMYVEMGVETNDLSHNWMVKYFLWINEHFNIALILTMPFFAFATFIVFKKYRHTYGEHLILNFLVYGLMTLLILPFAFFSSPLDISNPLGIVKAIISLVFFGWIFRGIFSLSWPKAIWKAILTYIVYFVSFMVFIIGLMLVFLILLLIYLGISKLFVG